MTQNSSDAGLEQRVKALEKELCACRQTLEALHDRERYLQSMIHNLQEGILIIDREYRITDANKAFMDMACSENEKIIGRCCYEILHGYNQPCDRFGEECLLQTVFETKQSGTCLHKHVHTDGSTVFVDLRLSPLKDKFGNATHVIEAIRDVSDLIKTEEKLRESEERYRNIFMNKYTPMLLIDPETTDIIDVNPAACSFYGFSKEKLTQMQITDINILTREQMAEEIDRAKLQGREFLIFRHRLAGGEIRDVEVYTGPIKINGKSLLFSIIHDITLRKQAEEALQKAHDELERRVEERTRELKIKTKNLEEVNIALKVLLKRRDEDKIELEEKVLLNVKELTVSYLDKLKKSGLDERQMTYINIMESNLNDIVSPFLHGLSTKYLKLTPMEIQVANLVKQGKSSKEIAELVNLSARTIEFHRDNIRKKMGIKNKKVNLRTYLLSMQ